jgi:hypothetical protein
MVWRRTKIGVSCTLVTILTMLAMASSFHMKSSQLHQRADTGLSSVASSRRDFMAGTVASVAFAGNLLTAASANADDTAQVATTILPKASMKEFLDPQGLFSIRVPQEFFTLRRTQKGDLPDAKTGKGRRGSSIFTAGNMAKAEVVAVER